MRRVDVDRRLLRLSSYNVPFGYFLRVVVVVTLHLGVHGHSNVVGLLRREVEFAPVNVNRWHHHSIARHGVLLQRVLERLLQHARVVDVVLQQHFLARTDQSRHAWQTDVHSRLLVVVYRRVVWVLVLLVLVLVVLVVLMVRGVVLLVMMAPCVVLWMMTRLGVVQRFRLHYRMRLHQSRMRGRVADGDRVHRGRIDQVLHRHDIPRR